jgi:transcriptional regulator with XRE-family HTH domain
MKLAEYLKSAGTTQEAFAARIGRSGASVSRLVNGLQKPDFDTMLAIDQATEGKVTVADFASDAA